MRTDPLPSVAADLLKQTLEHLAAPVVLFGGIAAAPAILLANAAARQAGLDAPPDWQAALGAALQPPEQERRALLAAIRDGQATLLRWTCANDGTITARVSPLETAADTAPLTMLTWTGAADAAPAEPHADLHETQRRLHDWLTQSKISRQSLDDFVRSLTERIADLYGLERASIWLFSEDQRTLRCVDRYLRSPQRHEDGEVMLAADYHDEFETLRRSVYMDVHDTDSDPRVAGYRESYLRPNDITSMLDAVIRFGGRTFGAICLEHVGKRHHWLPHEIDFACTIASYLATALESLARAEAEERTRERERSLAAVLDGSPIGIQVFATDGSSRRRNPAMLRMLGLDENSPVGRDYNLLEDEHAREDGRTETFHAALAGRATQIERRKIDFSQPGYEGWPVRRDAFWVESVFFPVFGPTGAVEAVVAFTWEVTDKVVAERQRDALESQLRQSQKLEAVGMLAGGVAHDFNNILTAVIGFSDMLCMQMPESDSRYELVTQVRKAADRGAALTKQLLTFGRVHMARVEVFDASNAVVEMMPMLRRLIEANIEVDIFASSTTPIEADRGQFQQVLLNLLVNARDAMPTGGKVTVAIDAPRGGFLCLTVRDNGHGMDEETRARVFEPFFTTKAAGRGTGLGLSTVYGIVSEAGGHIEVESQVDRGSMFRIYWPLAEDAPKPAATPAEPSNSTQHETVLVVEDDDANRALAAKILRHRGYRVLTAPDGEAALEVASDDAKIDLLLTDVVMPGMGGRALAERLVERRPDIRIVFTSGYTSDDVLRHGVQEDMVDFLPKPYSAEQLANIVRGALDA